MQKSIIILSLLLSLSMGQDDCPTDSIVRMLYHAVGMDQGTQAERNAEVYSVYVPVTEGVTYDVKIEVLRNDLGSVGKRVASIKIEGQEVGMMYNYACNPDGGDYDCTFFDCESQLSSNL